MERSEGQCSSFHFLWLVPVTIPADYNKAIDQAINEKGGDNLIDVRYYHEKKYFLLGVIDVFRVSGLVIRYKVSDPQ